ncbi:MAG TPA: hypothetical protein VLH61_10635 [Bacteroidales bacterium]|nr:hypothetical protein [Bacteroidales bacterium]
MDDLGLAAESILIKAKQLVFLNRQLKEKIKALENTKQEMAGKLAKQAALIAELEEKAVSTRFASLPGNKDSLQARQKVNELLREIEKCYSLLNR